MRLLGADQFLIRFRAARGVWAAGEWGSGKSRLILSLSRIWLQSGFSDAVIANIPVAWGMPLAVAPYRRCFVVLDELGAFFDSRSWQDKAANEYRKQMTAYLRKVDFYVGVASKVAPDSSFRPLWLARGITFTPFGWWLEQFRFGEGNPAEPSSEMGTFWLWGSDSLWSPRLPSPVYDSYSTPDDVTTLQAHFKESFARTRLGVQDPNASPFPDQVREFLQCPPRAA